MCCGYTEVGLLKVYLHHNCGILCVFQKNTDANKIYSLNNCISLFLLVSNSSTSKGVCMFALFFISRPLNTDPLRHHCFPFSSSSLVTHRLIFVLRLIALRCLCRLFTPGDWDESDGSAEKTDWASRRGNAGHSFWMYNICITQTTEWMTKQQRRRSKCKGGFVLVLFPLVIWPPSVEVEIVNIVRHLVYHLQSIWLGMIKVPKRWRIRLFIMKKTLQNKTTSKALLHHVSCFSNVDYDTEHADLNVSDRCAVGSTRDQGVVWKSQLERRLFTLKTNKRVSLVTVNCSRNLREEYK